MKRKPNVIYILADDMGYGDISALNENCGFTTPCLDEMAECGMAFCDAHASSAVCTPSRYSILTGRYNWRSRLKSSVLSGYSEALIEDGRRTVADLLRDQGYRTAAIGKWHLGMNFPITGEKEEKDRISSAGLADGIDYTGMIEKSPVANGFDYYFGISGSLDMPPYVYIENDHFTAVPDHLTKGSGKKVFFREGPTAPGFEHEKVLDQLTDKVLETMERYKEDPFFIYFPMPAPHTPIVPSEQFLGKSGTNEYGDFVLHCDDVVGRINRKLKELHLFEDTIVLFTSDNGCSPMADYPELLAAGHNPSYIYRGTKADIYEGGHRIPLLVQWPGKIPAGTKCDRLVCLSDFTATMADLLQVTLRDDEGVDSVSNLPLWMNPDAPQVREHVVHQSIDGSLSIREGNYKLEMCPGSGGWSDPKPGQEPEGSPSIQLYDLSVDIGEKVNVQAEHPDVVSRLRKKLKEQVLYGRSTPGPRQNNNGEAVWDTVQWLKEID